MVLEIGSVCLQRVIRIPFGLETNVPRVAIFRLERNAKSGPRNCVLKDLSYIFSVVQTILSIFLCKTLLPENLMSPLFKDKMRADHMLILHLFLCPKKLGT